MATDLYGIRVLSVDLDRREVEFRVFAVYYDTGSRTHAVLPVDDPAFFLRALWHEGRKQQPIGEAIGVERFQDREWMVKHARWFVEQVERTAVRNDPPADGTWARLKDFYYERSGGWGDEDLLVQGAYVVRVTDRAWIEHLEPLQAWGDVFYPMDADRPAIEDLPHVPNVHDPIVLDPFRGGTPYRLAFSDDGRYLAVGSYQDDLAVYDCADWSAQIATPGEPVFLPRVTWLPGRHVVVLTDLDEDVAEQAAYDVDARTFVEVPPQLWQSRSRTGLHRVTHHFIRGVAFLVENGTPVPVRGLEDPRIDGVDMEINDVAFTADETRLYIAGNKMGVLVADPATATIVDAIPDSPHSARLLALHPNGEYLAVVRSQHRNLWELPGPELCIRRLSDGAVILNHWPGDHITSIDWSPDGRWLAIGLEVDENQNELRIFPVGLPSEPPGDLLSGKD